jgi:hypothetical protein
VGNKSQVKKLKTKKQTFQKSRNYVKKKNKILPKSDYNYSPKEQKNFQKGIHINNNK